MLILNNNNIFSILFFDFCDCRFYHLKELSHLLRSTNSFEAEAEAGRRILLSNQYRIESLSLSHTSIIIIVFICLSIGVQS